MIKTLAGLVLLAAIASGAEPVAAQNPDLSGMWVLAKDKSDFGQLPVPDSRTDIIAHKEPALTVKRTISQGGPPAELELKYLVDGKPHTNQTPQGEVVSTLKWDGPTLVITSQLTTPNGDTQITDHYSLSADGKTLTQKRVIAVQGQELNQTLVLVKQ